MNFKYSSQSNLTRGIQASIGELEFASGPIQSSVQVALWSPHYGVKSRQSKADLSSLSSDEVSRNGVVRPRP
jgi:hypothetical protein